jgi:hypothetical protein
LGKGSTPIFLAYPKAGPEPFYYAFYRKNLFQPTDSYDEPDVKHRTEKD